MINNQQSLPRILVFTQYFKPSILSGEAESTSSMIYYLKQYFSFFVVCGNRDVGSEIKYSDIVYNKWIENENETVLYPNSIVSLYKATNYNSLNIQGIYINGIFSFYFSILPLIFCKLRKCPNIIIAPRGMLSETALKKRKRLKLLLIKFLQLFGIYNQIQWHVSNKNELQSVVSIFGRKIRSAVLQDLVLPYNLEQRKILKTPNSVNFIFIGQINWNKNLLFALEAVKQREEQIKFTIIGPVTEKEYWEKCKTVISQMSKNIEIDYIPRVEKKLLINCLINSHFLLYPSLTENFGHVIIESIQCGSPVIIGDLSQWKNIDKHNIGWNIDFEQIDNYLDRCVEMSQVEYDNMRESCYSYSNLFFDQSALINKYKKLFLKDLNE